MSIKVLYGCMFSGKTTSLIAECEELACRGLDIQAYKPSVDKRYSEQFIVSHNGESIKAITIDSLLDIPTPVGANRVIGIDEVHFFDSQDRERQIEYIVTLAQRNLIIISGLDYDYRGEAFRITSELIEASHEAMHMVGACSTPGCGGPAYRTAKIARESANKRFQVGGAEIYQPKCLEHFIEHNQTRGQSAEQ